MAQQKIADFFAEIGIKVSERSLKTLEKNLGKIVNKLEKAESAGRAMSGILKGTSKAADMENKSIQAGNKVLAERQKRYEAINRVAAKVQKSNAKVGRISAKTSMFATTAFDTYRRSGPARWQRASTGKGSVSGWNKNFKQALSSLTESSGAMSNKARAAQQAMYNSLFGAVDTSAADKQRAIMDRLHGQALREDSRRTRAAQNLARIQNNVARREQLMAERTATIREAGARRAAAIIQAAELKAQAMAARAAGGGTGGSGRRFGLMGGATIGGAIGSASSGVAGFLPGFGGAWSMMNLNRINQELQANRLAMTAVMGNEQAGGEQSTWLKNLANTVGFDYRQTMPAYTKMLASGQSAGLSTGSVQNIFKGVSEYGRVMGLDTESMKGSMRALEQMMNKGQVMSEELKGQLAERMPGVISAMTEAGGFKDPAELFKAMENGQVKSAQVLEKFAAILAERARQGDALEKAMKSSAAEQARFNNSFSDFVVAMGGKGMDAAFASMFQTMTRFFKENPKLADGMAQAMVKLANGFEVTAKAVGDFITAFDDLGDSLGLGGTDLAMLTATVAVLATHFGRVAAAGLLFVGVIQDISLGLKGQESYTKDFLDFLKDNAWAEIAVKTTAFAVGIGLIASNLMKVAGGIAAVSAAGAGGGMIGGLLGIISRHPVIAAIVAATTALNIAHEVYSERANAHLEKVKKTTDFQTSTAISNLQEKVTLDNFNRPMHDPFRAPTYDRLPGINAPMMMVDKISISVSGNGNPEETANLVMAKMKEVMKNLTVPE